MKTYDSTSYSRLVSYVLLSCLGFLAPIPAAAYNQSYYESYYQSYYQTYYQSYYQTYYQSTYALTITGGTTVQGSVSVTGALTKGSGSFLIDHPLDPKNKLLYHSFVESPDVKNIYDGIATLDANGEAVIQLPAYFEALNKDFRYQAKALNVPAPEIYIKDEVQNNRFTIAGGPPHARISWQVTGIRHDPYILAHPIIPEVEKGPDALFDKEEYLFEGYESVFARMKFALDRFLTRF